MQSDGGAVLREHLPVHAHTVFPALMPCMHAIRTRVRSAELHRCCFGFLTVSECVCSSIPSLRNVTLRARLRICVESAAQRMASVGRVPLGREMTTRQPRGERGVAWEGDSARRQMVHSATAARRSAPACFAATCAAAERSAAAICPSLPPESTHPCQPRGGHFESKYMHV